MTKRSSRLALVVTSALTSSILASPAWADCLASADGSTVTCSVADADGYNGSLVTGLTINVEPAADVTGTLSTGASSAVNNEGNINVGGTAISVGGGSTVSNASTATGIITGDILFGATTGTQVNTLNNFNAAMGGGIVGDISSLGAFTVNNTGTITGNLSSTGATTITNSGSITGDITLGAGNDTITNTGTLTGTVNMGAGTNVFNAANSAQMPSALLTADAAGLNTLNLGAGGGTIGAVTNFDVMNVNGAPDAFWFVTQAVSFSDRINLNGGFLEVRDADFLGANTIVNNAGPVSDAGLYFDNFASGTYSGNMSGTGIVYVGFGAGTGVTTFSGSNTYTGGTYISSGTLAVSGGSALSDAGDVYVGSLGVLDVTATETIGGLNDGGFYGGTGSVLLSGGDLKIGSGAFSGVISGVGGIEKLTTGTLTLSGANTFTGAAVVTNGTLALSGGAAIADATAVVVNSTATTAGTLSVNTAETIGSLAGSGGSVVLNAGLTTGGNNTSTTYAGVISGTGSLTKQGTGTFTLTGANTYSGGTTVNGGTLEGNSTSIQGAVLVNAGGTLLFTQPTNGTYAGAITGTGAVTKAGAGVLTLSGTNNGFSGTTNLNGGTVAIGSADNIGTGTLAFNGGTLQNTASLTLANAVTLGAGGGTFNTNASTTLTMSGPISGAGALTKTGTGTLLLTGFNTYAGGTTVSAGILKGGVGFSIQGDVVNNAQVHLTGTRQIYTGDMSGTGSVSVVDNSIIGFDGTNTYTGTTTIGAGNELYSFSDTALAPQSTFVVDGILGVGGLGTTPTNTIGALSGSGLVVVGGTLNVGANNSSTTFSGTFGSGGDFALDSLNVNKVGTGTLTLTGAGSVLTGNLGVNAGTLDLDGTLTAATTTVANGATLFVDGTLTSPTVSIATGGKLGGGIGTTAGNIVGAVTNAGNVAPGHSPGILAISGSYTQTAAGTYTAEVNGIGSSTVVAGTNYDRISVSGTPGTATLAGNLVVVQNGGLYVAGTQYDIIKATGGITGSMAISGNVISPFITLSNATANGGGIVTTTAANDTYRLVVVRSNYNTVATNANQTAVANGLQGLVPVAGAATTVVKIDNMTAAQARDLFNTASPEPYGAYATALQDQGELFTRQVATRLSSVTGEGTGLWLNGYGQWGDGDSPDFRFGSDHRIYGVAGGVDFAVGGVRLGVAAGYSEDEVDYIQGNSSGKSEAWQVGGYAAFASGPLQIDAQLAYVSGDINATKQVNAGSGATLITGTSAATTNGDLFKGIATIGYNLGTENLTVRPYIGVDYTSGKVDGFTETGMGVLNLTVADIDADRTDAVVGINIAAPMGNVTPYVNASYNYRTDNDPRTVTAYFNGLTGSPFTVTAINSGRSSIEADAGLAVNIGGASVFVGYQGTFRNDLDSHGVNGGVRFSF